MEITTLFLEVGVSNMKLSSDGRSDVSGIEFEELKVFSVSSHRNFMTTCVSFDTHEQLLWAGTDAVSISVAFMYYCFY